MKKNDSVVKGTVKTARFVIPYRIYENKGPHIICVNGVQQSMGMWHTLVTRFSPDYRIILFDFPNQGKAEILSGPNLVSLQEQVNILSAILDETGVNKNAALCAASWGGVIAADFAAKYPDRIKTLILASLGTKPNKKMVETIMQGAKIDLHDREKMAQVLIKAFGENLPLQLKNKIISQFRTMKEDALRSFYEHGLFVVASKKLSEIVDLKSIKVKTILLNGENDTIIDLEDVKFLASQIPDCEMRIIKGVGHFMHMESDTVLDIYEGILASLHK